MATYDDSDEVKAKPIQGIVTSGQSTHGRIHLPRSLSKPTTIPTDVCPQLPLNLPKIETLQLQKVSSQGHKPQIFKLHSVLKQFQDKKFTRFTVGLPGSLTVDPRTMDSERVLMLVGATGTGKTTLINGIANFIYGTKWEDDFRLKIIHEESVP